MNFIKQKKDRGNEKSGESRFLGMNGENSEYQKVINR